MKVSILGFGQSELNTEKTENVRDIIEYMLLSHGITSESLTIFSLVNTKTQEIYELDQTVLCSSDQEYQIIPRHFTNVDVNMPQNLMYCILCYCYRMYSQNLWNYTEISIIRLAMMTQILFKQTNTKTKEPINHESGITYLKKHFEASGEEELYYQFTVKLHELFPERQKCMYRRVTEHIQRIDLMFLDEFKALTLQNQIVATVKLYLESSYHHFYYYPVYDRDIDWTSSVGLAQDGMCMVDSELQLGYLYLPYSSFKIESITEHTIVLKTTAKEARDMEQSTYVEDDDTDTRTVFRSLTRIDIPVYPKISEKHSMRPIMSYKIEQAKQTIMTASYADEPEVPLPENSDKLRHHLTITFKNQNHTENFAKIVQMYQTQEKAPNPDSDLNRNLRIQSRTTTELFQSLYLNNTTRFCSVPSKKLMNQIDLINDLYYFRSKKLILNDFEFSNEEMHHITIRAIVASIVAVLNFKPKHNTIVIKDTERSIRFTSGSGTPYSPFVPQMPQMFNNIKIQKFSLNSNNFQQIEFVSELMPLLKNHQVKQDLIVLHITENVLKQKGAIMIADKLKAYKSLEQLNISNAKVGPTGVSCVLYLLDFNKQYLRSLSIAQCKFKTKNQIRQLATYIVNCFKNNMDFVYLDISGCIKTLAHAEAFVIALENYKIPTICVKDTIPEVADSISRAAVKIEL
ncbi:Conserved_hypothetical protein [Hexamita inflata]|uniref:Uncharacterized protein n=2 Tax=Hexamita inflata TaxID=28002 RepID=A0AA86QEZ8_9EUKA|nr:Conserved hypothetical protein [Hexamita inflata]